MPNLAFENLIVRLLLLIVEILRRPPELRREPETREQREDRDALRGRAVAFLNDKNRRAQAKQ